MNNRKYIITFWILTELVFICNYYIYFIGIYQKPEFNLLINVFELFLVLMIGWTLFRISKSNKMDLKNIHYNFKDLLLFSLFANYKVIFVFTNNILEFPLKIFLYALGLGICFFGIIFAISKMIFKNETKALYYTIIISLLLYSLNITERGFYLFNTIKFDIFTFICLVLIIVYFSFIKNLDKLLNFCKNVTIILLIISAINILFTTSSYYINILARTNRPLIVKHNKQSSRNIYIILLDAYTGDSTLKTLGYNNKPFYDSLSRRGFFIYPDITSNYNKTFGTIPSILNFDYIEALPYSTPADAIDNSLMFYMAKQNGYKLYYLNSYVTAFKLAPKHYYKLYSDLEFVYTEAFSSIYNGSLLFRLKKIFINSNLENNEDFISETINDNTNKKLVFLHFMMPHYPYVYDENGNIQKDDSDIRQPDTSFKINSRSYISYLKYANKYSLSLVDKILAAKKKEPIIIIFGDHGIRKRYFFWGEPQKMNDLTKDPLFLPSHFNTFIAYYNPDLKEYKPARTLLNFYRQFANEVFGTSFKPLEEKSFYFYYNTGPDEFKSSQGFWVR